MKIIGGLAKGIKVLTSNNNNFKPTTSKLRESLFSFLAHNNLIINKNFIDLFAGSGSYGLEAFSRGAKSGVFIEYNTQLIDIINKNLIKLKKHLNFHQFNYFVNKQNLLKKSNNINKYEKFDLIFIDPPYAYYKEKNFINNIISKIENNIYRENKNSKIIFETVYPNEELIYICEKNKLNLIKNIGKKKPKKPFIYIFSS